MSVDKKDQKFGNNQDLLELDLRNIVKQQNDVPNNDALQKKESYFPNESKSLNSEKLDNLNDNNIEKNNTSSENDSIKISDSTGETTALSESDNANTDNNAEAASQAKVASGFKKENTKFSNSRLPKFSTDLNANNSENSTKKSDIAQTKIEIENEIPSIIEEPVVESQKVHKTGRKTAGKNKFKGTENSTAGNASEAIATNKNIVFDTKVHKKFYQKLSFQLIMLFSFLIIAAVVTVVLILVLGKDPQKPKSILTSYTNLYQLDDGRLVAKDSFTITPNYDAAFGDNSKKIVITTDQDATSQIGGTIVEFDKTTVTPGESVTVTPRRNLSGIVNGGKIIITFSDGVTGEVKNSITVIVDSAVNSISLNPFEHQSDVFKIVDMNSAQADDSTDKYKLFINQTATISRENFSILPVNTATANLFKDFYLDFASEADRNLGLIEIGTDGKTVKALKAGTVNLVARVAKWLDGVEKVSSEPFALKVDVPPILSIELKKDISILNNLFIGNTNTILVKDIVNRVNVKYNLEENNSAAISEYIIGLKGEEWLGLDLIAQNSGVTIAYNSSKSELLGGNAYDITMPKTYNFAGTLDFTLTLNKASIDTNLIDTQIIGYAKEYTKMFARLKQDTLTQTCFTAKLAGDKYAFTRLDLSEFFEVVPADEFITYSKINETNLKYATTQGNIIDKYFYPKADEATSLIYAYVEGSTFESGSTNQPGLSIEPLNITNTLVSPNLQLSNNFMQSASNGNYVGLSLTYGTGVFDDGTNFITVDDISDKAFTFDSKGAIWYKADKTVEFAPAIIANMENEINADFKTTDMKAELNTNDIDGISIEQVLDVDNITPTGKIKVTSLKPGEYTIFANIVDKNSDSVNKICTASKTFVIEENITFTQGLKVTNLFPYAVSKYSMPSNNATYLAPEYPVDDTLAYSDYLSDIVIDFIPEDGNPLNIFGKQITGYDGTSIGNFTFKIKASRNGEVLLLGADSNGSYDIKVYDPTLVFSNNVSENILTYSQPVSFKVIGQSSIRPLHFYNPNLGKLVQLTNYFDKDQVTMQAFIAGTTGDGSDDKILIDGVDPTKAEVTLGYEAGVLNLTVLPNLANNDIFYNQTPTITVRVTFTQDDITLTSDYNFIISITEDLNGNINGGGGNGGGGNGGGGNGGGEGGDE